MKKSKVVAFLIIVVLVGLSTSIVYAASPTPTAQQKKAFMRKNDAKYNNNSQVSYHNNYKQQGAAANLFVEAPGNVGEKTRDKKRPEEHNSYARCNNCGVFQLHYKSQREG